MIPTSSFVNFGNLYSTRKYLFPLDFNIYCLCSTFHVFSVNAYIWFLVLGGVFFFYFFSLCLNYNFQGFMHAIHFLWGQILHFYSFFSCILLVSTLITPSYFLFDLLYSSSRLSLILRLIIFILSVVDIKSNSVKCYPDKFYCYSIRFWHWIVSSLC